jgi:hypothetical protein
MLWQPGMFISHITDSSRNYGFAQYTQGYGTWVAQALLNYNVVGSNITVVIKLTLQCQGIKKPRFASNVDDLLADRVSGEVGSQRTFWLNVQCKLDVV